MIFTHDFSQYLNHLGNMKIQSGPITTQIDNLYVGNLLEPEANNTKVVLRKEIPIIQKDDSYEYSFRFWFGYLLENNKLTNPFDKFSNFIPKGIEISDLQTITPGQTSQIQLESLRFIKDYPLINWASSCPPPPP